PHFARRAPCLPVRFARQVDRDARCFPR
ncbi:hypothetical protein BN1723_020369, partial [Verticillium longisporum]